MSFVKELDVAIETAIEAGELIMEYYKKENRVEWKGKGDPVTIADKESQLVITENLKRNFPDDILLGEEGEDREERLDHEKRVWIFDPLDGTVDFMEGVDHFAVMIGLVVGNEPVLGVIYQPTKKLLWYAHRKKGAWKENLLRGVKNRMVASAQKKIEDMKLVITKNHHSKFIDMSIELLGIKNYERMGSVGLKIVAVSEGRKDLYVHVTDRTKLWDLCAPEIILKEAGGKCTDLLGNRFEYRKKRLNNPFGIIASNGRVHDEIVKRLRPVVEASGLLEKYKTELQ